MEFKKTVFIAIAFGTSVRDVLRNDTFKILKQKEDLRIVVFAQDNTPAFQSEFGGNNVIFEPLLKIKSTWTEELLLHFHRATLRDICKTIDLGNVYGDTRIMDRFTPLARLLKRVLGKSRLNKLIYYLYKVLSPSKYYNAEFEKYNPDLVVVTRVLNYSRDYPMMRAATKLNVPVISLVGSWDNFTSKGFFPFSLSGIVVWNEVLKNEAVNLFGFPEAQVFISGIPRYDVSFRKEGFCSKNEFIIKNKLDSKKRTITYATGTSTLGVTSLDPVSPEPEIALFLANSIIEGLIPDAQLIVRLHPQADPEQYKKLNALQNVYIHVPGKASSFQDRLFTVRDDVDLGETMLYSDVVVNFASTITIDAASADTPVVCINFDFRGVRPNNKSLKRLYKFDHYAKLLECNGVKLVSSKEELIAAILTYLKNPQVDSDGRKRITDQQCYYTDGQAGKRVAGYLINNLFTE